MKSFILFAFLISSVASATSVPASTEEAKKEENLTTEEGKEESKTEEAQQEVKAH